MAAGRGIRSLVMHCQVTSNCYTPFIARRLNSVERNNILLKSINRSLICTPRSRTLQNGGVLNREGATLTSCGRHVNSLISCNLVPITCYSTLTLKQLNTTNHVRNSICSRKLQMNSILVLVRNYVDDSTVRRKIDLISEKFAEARELLDDARESVGTVYFKEDMKEAQEAIEEVLRDYENLLDTVSDNQKDDVVRSIGLKMQELRAQLNLLLEQIMH